MKSTDSTTSAVSFDLNERCPRCLRILETELSAEFPRKSRPSSPWDLTGRAILGSAAGDINAGSAAQETLCDMPLRWFARFCAGESGEKQEVS